MLDAEKREASNIETLGMGPGLRRCMYVCVHVHVYVYVHCNLSYTTCREVRELESRLDELRSKTEIRSLEDRNKENTEVIQSKLNSGSFNHSQLVFHTYRGWGALGFPIPNSDFPPQTLQLDRILCISFPPQWHQILHLLIIKSVILYEILPAH